MQCGRWQVVATTWLLGACTLSNPGFDVRPDDEVTSTSPGSTPTEAPTTASDATTSTSEASTTTETSETTEPLGSTSTDTEQPPECGNGIVEPGEVCDDGNAIETDACVHCQMATCGDGFVHDGVEVCDDGNNDDEDECDNECKSNTCNNGKIDPHEPCDPTAPPYNGALAQLNGLCREDCQFRTCLRVSNDENPSEVFANNTWFDPCIQAEGSRIVFALINTDRELEFIAFATKTEHMWENDNITRGAKDFADEFERQNHDHSLKMHQLFPSPGSYSLIITSQIADGSKYLSQGVTCHRDLGDGYGIAVFPEQGSGQLPVMLVMGHKGGVTGHQRELTGFDASTELAYNGGEPMNVCGAPGVTGFSGKLLLSILP